MKKLKIGQTVVSPFDKMYHPSMKDLPYSFCSRCRKIVRENRIEIKPIYLLKTRRLKYFYTYHQHCIRTNKRILQLNFIGFWALYKWERIQRKLVFWDYLKRITNGH